jgi:hypothetical protein
VKEITWQNIKWPILVAAEHRYPGLESHSGHVCLASFFMPSHVLIRHAEARLNNIYKISPHLTENRTLHHYKDQLVNAVSVIIAVYTENHTKYTSTLRRQNAEVIDC